MSQRFLGQFLLEKGMLQKDGLRRAVLYQNSHNAKIGELAVRNGWITQIDCDLIHRVQRRTDARFGQIAVQMGLLLGAQVDALLLEQKQSHVPIGEALIEVGAITKEQLDVGLLAFKAAEEASAREINCVQDIVVGDIRRVCTSFTQMSSRLLIRFADLLAKEGVPWETTHGLPHSDVLICLPIRGDWSGVYVLGLPENIAQKIATRMEAGDKSLHQHARIAAKEFGSMVCAQACWLLASSGICCSTSGPAELSDGWRTRILQQSITIFPLVTIEGRVDVSLISDPTITQDISQPTP